VGCGNGLRPDIWNTFKDRFRIPQILEFYAATEGNVTMFNVEGKPGAIGRIPAFLAHRSPVALVKHDVETGELVRNTQGMCMRCGPDEVGEAIGKILEGSSNVGSRFEGYTSQRDSERKIVRNVFDAGDAWFRTGDLMSRDEKGFFYFVDRIGDTFRWKGENVSTSEVSEAINAFPGIADAAVYGVAIPGTEGRAGMAAIVCDGVLDLAAFRSHLVKSLPEYARPLFLRVRDKIEVTATFKHQKNDLACCGFDPAKVSGPLYFDDPAHQAFVRLDPELYDRIQTRRVRL
jgi:fatty-acyl-CoA synthase